MVNELSKVKQPAPSVSANAGTIDNQGKKYKLIQSTTNDIVSTPKISNTPITDWVELKRKENPHIIYKITEKRYNITGFQTAAGIGAVACGIASLIKLFKK